jgi:hypothetical protein
VQDCVNYVSFETDEAGFAAFLQSTLIEEPLSEKLADSRFLDAPASLGWSIDMAVVYLQGEGNNNGGGINIFWLIHRYSWGRFILSPGFPKVGSRKRAKARTTQASSLRST